MNFDLFEQQKKFLSAVFNPEKRVIVYGGGVKGGKTTAGLISGLLLLKKYQGAKLTIVRESLPSLKRNTFPHFNKILPYHKINGSSFTCDYNGGEVLFFSENYDQDKDLNRWKGLDTNFFLLEEVNELNKDSFLKAIERAGTWLIPDVAKENQPPPKIIATLNPARGFVKELVYDRWRNGTLPDSWAFIQSLAEDNPHNTEEWKAMQKENLPDWHYEVYFNGNWDKLVLDDAFLSEFRYDTHVSNEAVLRQDEPIYISFDFNVNPFCVSIWQHSYDWAHKIQEYYLENSDIYRVCGAIKSDYSNHIDSGYFFVNGDATGQNRSAFTQGNINAYDIIKSQLGTRWNNFKIPTVNPSLLNSNLLCNAFFKVVKDIKVHPSCVETIKDYQECPRDYKTKQWENKNPMRGHILDTDRYYIQANHYDKLSMEF